MLHHDHDMLKYLTIEYFEYVTENNTAGRRTGRQKSKVAILQRNFQRLLSVSMIVPQVVQRNITTRIIQFWTLMSFNLVGKS